LINEITLMLINKLRLRYRYFKVNNSFLICSVTLKLTIKFYKRFSINIKYQFMRLLRNFAIEDVGLEEKEREREREGERKSVNGPFARVVSCFHIVPLYHGVLSSGLCYERNPIARVATQVLLNSASVRC